MPAGAAIADDRCAADEGQGRCAEREQEGEGNGGTAHGAPISLAAERLSTLLDSIHAKVGPAIMGREFADRDDRYIFTSRKDRAPCCRLISMPEELVGLAGRPATIAVKKK
jgi:hypothetical protein